MITTSLTHPGILRALAGAGHGALVAIVDGNFSASTHRGPRAEVVHLNLGPGCLDAVTVTRAVTSVLPVEEAIVMRPLPTGPYAMPGDPRIWADFRRALDDRGHSAPLEPVSREEFCRMVAGDETALVVVTGEARLYGNLILRVGVVRPGAEGPTPAPAAPGGAA